jgi:formylglycine-generating enzyme required for sulfatase activity
MISWSIALVILLLLAGCGGPAVTPTLGTSRQGPGSEIVMVDVPAGVFLMGSDPAVDLHAFHNELPRHKVYLDAYRIARYEVTNVLYARCVRAGACQEPGDLTYYANLNYAAHPVVYVSWSDAQAFCEWIGGRLPTEAEWEYAARGPQGSAYPWGDAFDCARGNFYGADACDPYAGTAPVGSFESGASWRGLHDLAGNVWEWVADWYGAYPSAAQENPRGPERGAYKVLRGGLWPDLWESTRSANRFTYSPDFRDPYIGFRCVLPSGTGG